MVIGKNLTTAEKKKIVIEWGNVHFGDTKGALQRLSKDEKAVEKYLVDNLKERKRTYFLEMNIKWIIAKPPFFTSTQIFEKAGIEGRTKRCDILCEMGSVKKKKSPRKPSFSKANVLKYQNWTSTFLKQFSQTNLEWHLMDLMDEP